MNGAPKLRLNNEGYQEPEKKPETRLEEQSAMTLEGLRAEALKRNLRLPANENDRNDQVETQDDLSEDEDPFAPFPAMQTGADPEEVRKAILRAQAKDANHHLR
jgi:hypothetical protein